MDESEIVPMNAREHSRTALVLSYREGFSVNDATSISLTIAEQLADDHADILILGGPNAIASGAPLVEGIMHPLRLPWWPIGPHNRRYERAIRHKVAELSLDRLELHNRGVLFHRLSDLPIGLALYLHNDPYLVGGLKTQSDRLKILKRADYVVCVSEYIRQRFCEGLPDVLCDKVHIVYNTLNLEDFLPHEEKRNEIVFVGRFIPEKGIVPLLQALKTTLPKYPDWRAGIIGARYFGQKGLHYPYEKELLEELGTLHPQIDMPGYRPFTEVIELFKRARIAVVPSTWEEPFGRTALEGMAAGCAVIASRRGGLPEVLGGAGLLVEPTAEPLSAALDALMGDPQYCDSVGQMCLMRARTAFNPEPIHRQINELRRSLRT